MITTTMRTATITAKSIMMTTIRRGAAVVVLETEPLVAVAAAVAWQGQTTINKEQK